MGEICAIPLCGSRHENSGTPSLMPGLLVTKGTFMRKLALLIVQTARRPALPPGLAVWRRPLPNADALSPLLNESTHS